MRGPGDDQEAEPAAAMRERVEASFARQAMMATLGAELVSVDRGRVEMALPHDARFTQQHGFVHDARNEDAPGDYAGPGAAYRTENGMVSGRSCERRRAVG